MEIERKFLPLRLPEDLAQYPAHHIEQGYLCVEPELRVRHSGDRFYLTYKGKGLMARQEEAEAFAAPDWFGRDVTFDPAYHNSVMSRRKFD